MSKLPGSSEDFRKSVAIRNAQRTSMFIAGMVAAEHTAAAERTQPDVTESAAAPNETG
jgi:hypothetical protein